MTTQRRSDARVTSDPVIAALRRQAMIVEHLYDGIIVTDPDGVILDWNSAAERMFGYTKAEVVGQKAEMLNRPGEGPAISGAIQAAMAADGYWTGELTAVAKDGSERAVEASVIALKDTRGRTIGRVAVNRDITEQRRAERVQSAAFLISEAANRTQNLQELFRAIHEIVGGLMPARNFYVALSDPASDLISYPYHEDEHDVVPAPHRPGRGLTELVLKRGERLLVTPERPGPERDGSVDLVGTRSLDWLGVPLKVGERTIGMFAVQSYSRQVRYGEHEAQILQLVASQVATAIERQRLETERRGEQEFLRQVIDLNPNLIFVKDWEGRFTLVNSAIAELYGSSAEDLIGKGDGDFNANVEEVAQYRRDDQEAMTTGRPKFILEERNTDARTGRQRWFQVIKVPLHSPDGAPHVLGVATEITQRKELEHQLRQAQKMEAVGQLAGGIAHDFNNVLTAILGYTRLLLKEPELGARHRDDVTEIEEAAQRAASLTRQLLAFSRKQVMQPTVLNVNEVVQGMRSLLRRLIGEHITLVAAFDPEPVFVRADQGQLQQVLVNLSVNARDAMPSGGTLMLATARVDLDAAFKAAHPGSTVGPHVRLLVSDSGTGMDAEVRRRVFEPFFTTKPVGKGSGLGLATVYGIVKQSGGYIDVESQPGHGSTFTIYLPRVAAPTQPTPEPPAPPPRPGRETVLLVEDESGVRALARRALKEFGYRVLEATNGAEALTVARGCDDQIDLLLTDVVMPEMGGRELAQVLKQERPETRVLFTSGYPDSGGMALDVAESGVPYLPKPYTPNELAQKVREVLDGAGERR
ncbi:MAG TPA: PAS domain S-box protein [Gemmatimonadales bacterium]|jgi:PAS domain S-box-containing protein|nr:PAS domain S-box protein [Gemmatimonadales bacterium]